jgi:hypothetical protein
MYMNISTEKMPHYTDFRPLQNLCSCLDISTLQYPKKLLCITDIISENCRNLHLKPLSANIIQTVTQSVQSVSARLLMNFEPLYKQKDKELGVT